MQSANVCGFVNLWPTQNYYYNYNEIYLYHGYIIYKIEIIFPHSLLHINTLFPPLRETLYAGRVKFFAEESKLYKHAVFQLVVRNTASSECILQTAKKCGSQRVLNRSRREDDGHQSSPLLQLPPLCAYRCAVWRLYSSFYPKGLNNYKVTTAAQRR